MIQAFHIIGTHQAEHTIIGVFQALPVFIIIIGGDTVMAHSQTAIAGITGIK
jgi:hypothetical protein